MIRLPLKNIHDKKKDDTCDVLSQKTMDAIRCQFFEKRRYCNTR